MESYAVWYEHLLTLRHGVAQKTIRYGKTHFIDRCGAVPLRYRLRLVNRSTIRYDFVPAQELFVKL